MALLSEAVNPFKGVEQDGFYFKISDFAFQLGLGGRIGFQAFLSEESRRADGIPYLLPQQAREVIVEAADMDSLVGHLFDYIAELMANCPEFKGVPRDGAGFVKSFTDPYGETHDKAFYTPVFAEGSLIAGSMLIKLGVFASKGACESGAVAFPVDSKSALGGNVLIANLDGSKEEVQLNPNLPSFDHFIGELDKRGGRPAFYGYAKSKCPFKDKCEDCQDMLP